MAVMHLSFADYLVICGTLFFSSGYGLYYGYFKNGTSGTMEYLLANRRMTMIPVAFSYFATIASSGVIIGYPNEVYVFGYQIVLICLSVFPSALIVNEIFIPVYHKLESANVYEYLEKRYSKSIKNIIVVCIIFQAIALSSANVFGPSTVLSQVTGLDAHLIVVILSTLCLSYTTLGGIKAVIYADVIQAILIFVSVGTLLVCGSLYLGGLSVVYQANMETGRLNIFNMDFNLNVRQTFWSTLIGYFFFFLSLTATSQFALQRFMTLPTYKIAQRANILGTCFFSLSLFLSHSLGLVTYATFHGCDPLKRGIIQNMDQFLPAFIMRILSYPALPGLIFSGIVCASLSTLSSVYNSAAALIFMSFVKPLSPNLSDKRSTLICKLLVCSVGILSIFGVLIVELFPNITQSFLALFSAVSAPLLGLLLIGIFFPEANKKAATLSFLLSVLLLVWITTGTLIQKPILETKPLTTDNCESISNGTLDIDESVMLLNSSFEDLNVGQNSTSRWMAFFPLSSISILWYSTIGLLSCIVTFAFFSMFAGKEKIKNKNLDMIPKFVQNLHCSMPVRLRKIFLCDVYD